MDTTTDTPTSLRRATLGDRARVVDSVVAAFVRDPAFRYFFPGDDEYAEQAPSFAGYLFDRRLDFGTAWVAEDGAAVAMWNPPGAQTAEAAIPGMSDEALARLAAWDTAVHPLLPQEPHWYLGVLATHPDAAGRRLGRTVMAPGLRAAQDAGLPAYLETATQTNVGIYERGGWTVTGRVRVAGIDAAIMRHD